MIWVIMHVLNGLWDEIDEFGMIFVSNMIG